MHIRRLACLVSMGLTKQTIMANAIKPLGNTCGIKRRMNSWVSEFHRFIHITADTGLYMWN
jgi:hypothetical protein